jgi:hypothetical protein
MSTPHFLRKGLTDRILAMEMVGRATVAPEETGQSACTKPFARLGYAVIGTN